MFGRLFFCSLLVVLPLRSAVAASITIGDFGPDTVVIDFDSVTGYLDGSEFGAGVTLTTGPGVVPAADVVPADFVHVAMEFPDAMASPPNKIVGAHVFESGALGECKFCAILVGFDTPREQVGFWVTDPDQGQFANFYGPAGLLGTLTVSGGSSATAYFMGFEDAGGISRVELHSQTWLGVGMDDLMFSVPEPGTGWLFGLGLGVTWMVRRTPYPRSNLKHE